MLSIRHVSKTYANGVHALRGVSLDVPNGIFGLLGANGAGKTVPHAHDCDSSAAGSGDDHFCRR